MNRVKYIYQSNEAKFLAFFVAFVLPCGDLIWRYPYSVQNTTNSHAAFVLIYLCQKLQSQTVIREKLRRTILYKKSCS